MVRYGNVMGSRGSVIPFFRRLARRAGESLPITDLRMTRFLITLPQAVQFVVDSFDLMHGGELYVPRIPRMKIVDLAEAIAPDATMHEIGLRPGEKLHEEMISPEEGRRALPLGDRYVVQPDLATWGYEPPGRRRARAGRLRLPLGHQRRVAHARGRRRAAARRTSDVLPYGRQSIDESDVTAVIEVLRGDWLTTGPAVTRARSGAVPTVGGHHVRHLHLGHRCPAHRLRRRWSSVPATRWSRRR